MRHELKQRCDKCQQMMYDGISNSLLRTWFEDLQNHRPEIHIAYTYRNKDEQDRLFREGKSKAKFGQSPHNYKPCMAIDIFFLIDGKYYLDMKWLEGIANALPEGLEWGGNFPSFKDGPHFQVTDWKKKVTNYPNGDK